MDLFEDVVWVNGSDYVDVKLSRKIPPGKIKTAKIVKRDVNQNKFKTSPSILEEMCEEESQQKVIKEVKNNNLYKLVKDQFSMMVEYINILEKKNSSEEDVEVDYLLELVELTKRQCEIHLKFKTLNNRT